MRCVCLFGLVCFVLRLTPVSSVGTAQAFLFPVIHQLMNTDLPMPPSQPYRGAGGPRPIIYPYCLVLAPTRELVMQIHNEARKVYAASAFVIGLAWLGFALCCAESDLM